MKKPRKTQVTYTIVESTRSEYTCPFCNIHFVGAGIGKNITRFLCTNCNNEIIVTR